jgi:hypothetical protein
MPRMQDRLPPGSVDTRRHVFAPLAAHPLDPPYRVAGAPHRYRLLQPFVERLVEHVLDQLLRALDWPHTKCYASVPDDGPLLGLLGDWLPTLGLPAKSAVRQSRAPLLGGAATTIRIE